MKALFIGDIHGLTIWSDIVSKHTDVDQIVFMGDYFDSFDIPGIDQLHNFKEIIRFIESTDIKVTLLIGNHDHHYWGSDKRYKGYQGAMAFQFYDALEENKKHLQVAEIIDDILLTHAGVSPVWMDDNIDGWTIDTIKDDLNDLFKYRPRSFNFVNIIGSDYDGTGDSVESSPFWIRERSLLKSNKRDKVIKDVYRQVVGHTNMGNIFKSFKASKHKRGDKYFFIDTLPSKGYVIYDNGELIPMEL